MENKIDDLGPPMSSDLGGLEAQLQSSAIGARNVIVANLGNLFGFFVGFFLTPILLFHLGASQFGTWSLLVSILGYIGLLQCGLNVALPQQIAEAVGLQDRQRLTKILGTALFVYLIYAVISLSLTLILAFTFQHFLNVPKNLVENSRICLLILGLNQFISIIFVVRDSILYGTGRMYVTSSFSIFFNLTNSAIQLFAVIKGYGIVGMACSTLLVSLFSILIYNKIIGRDWTGAGIAIKVKNSSMTIAKNLFAMGFRSFLISFSGTLGSGSNVLIIGALLPVRYVAYYAISSKLISMINTLATKVNDVSLPVYSQAQSRGDFGRIFKIYSENVSLSLAVCLPFTLACVAFGDRMINAWVGRGYEEAYPILAIDSVLMLFLIPGAASIAILNGTNRSHFISKIYPVSAVFNCLISVVLTHLIGAPGVVLGSLMIASIIDFQLLPYLVCREFGFSITRFWISVAKPLSAQFAIAVISIVLIKMLHVPPTRLSTAASISFVLLPAWCVWFMTGLQLERRERYLNSMRGAFKRLQT